MPLARPTFAEKTLATTTTASLTTSGAEKHLRTAARRSAARHGRECARKAFVEKDGSRRVACGAHGRTAARQRLAPLLSVSAAKRRNFIVFLGREAQNSAVRAGLTARRSSGAGRPGTIRGETRRSVHKVSLVRGPRHHAEPSTPPAKTLVRVPCGRVRSSHTSRTIGVESPYGRQAPVNKATR